MPLFFTLVITKFVLKAVRLLGQGGGSALPGLIAEKLDSRVAAKLSRRLPKGSIVVTGTNGKTTTTKMILAILEASGLRVVTNRSGSNLYRGVVSALIERSNLFGRFKADIGLFEVDEASMPAVCTALNPKSVLVLNLFRDQLDRYGELDTTARVIGRALKGVEGDIHLNADDPLVASLAKYASGAGKIHYFGVEGSKAKRLQHDLAVDSNHCPNDGMALAYSKNFFGHIGHYACPKGDFGRPKPAFGLVEVGSGYSINGNNIKLPLPGLYNAYNALAAVASVQSLAIDIKAAVAAVEHVTAAFGRVEQLTVRGRKVYLLLIKNPTGFNQVIQTFLGASSEQSGASIKQPNLKMLTPHSSLPTTHVMVAINDNFADGRDVSWLWDVGFEELAIPAVRSEQSGVSRAESTLIVASGIRAHDLALRLKYADIPSEVEVNLGQAFERLIEGTPKGQTAYVLPTYTAMLELRKYLEKSAGLKGFWK